MSGKGRLDHVDDRLRGLLGRARVHGWLGVVLDPQLDGLGRAYNVVRKGDTREELFAAYERAGGAPVDPERVRFWEVFGNLKWAIICIMQAKTHLDGLVHSVELAAIGRRTAETEIELLNLIQERDR